LRSLAPRVLAVIAERGAQSSARIEIYRADAKDEPTPVNVDTYSVVEDAAAQWDLPTLFNVLSTEDNQNMRSYLQENVFLIKEDPGPGHWLPELPGPVLTIVQKT